MNIFIIYQESPTNNVRLNRQIQEAQNFRDSPLRSSLKKSGSANRAERSFVKSPTPIREIPNMQVEDEELDPISPTNILDKELEDDRSANGKNSRNRFKKKMPIRSKSVESSVLADNPLIKTVEEPTLNKNVKIGMISKNPFIINNNNNNNNNNKGDIPTITLNDNSVFANKSNRPNLIRQNALTNSFSKSLGANLDRIHDSPTRSYLGGRHQARHQHHHKSTKRYGRGTRKSRYASSSLTSSMSSESDRPHTYSATSSSSEFSPRASTVNLQRLVRSRNQLACQDSNSQNKRIRNGSC